MEIISVLMLILQLFVFILAINRYNPAICFIPVPKTGSRFLTSYVVVCFMFNELR
jgi:hypothetical protein